MPEHLNKIVEAMVDFDAYVNVHFHLAKATHAYGFAFASIIGENQA